VLLLLSALAATTLYISRTNAVLVRRSYQLAQTQAAADAAVVYTLSNLSDEQVSRHGSIDGSSRSWQFNGIDVTIAVSDESGRIDVNAADDDLIYAFLMSQGLAEDESHTMVSDLRQWQQVGDPEIRPSNGMNAGPLVPGPASPKRRLQSIDELNNIPTWKSQPLGCWAEALTVYTGSPNLSNHSTDGATSALRWADEHHVGQRQWLQSASALAQANAPQSVIGQVLRIETHAKLTGDVSATAEWVGRLTGNSSAPMLTMRWTHSSSHREGTCGITVAGSAATS
jgi:general secretion pathway protein K